MDIMIKILVQPHKWSQIRATWANNNLYIITLGRATEETCSLKQHMGIRLQLGGFKERLCRGEIDGLSLKRLKNKAPKKHGNSKSM